MTVRTTLEEDLLDNTLQKGCLAGQMESMITSTGRDWKGIGDGGKM